MEKPNKNALDLQVIQQVAGLVSQITGIEFTSKHNAMIQSRVARRMSKIGIETGEAYIAHLKANAAAETSALVSLLTTHHTRFFREFSHFEYMRIHALPQLVARLKKENKKKLRILSAACSTGHEVYSLAMYLKKHLPEIDPSMDFEILGTDVDPISVKIGHNGVYRWDELKESPAAYLNNNWARGEGDIADFVKARIDLKRHCKFEVSNLMGLDKEAMGEPFHLIFCRNVFIYFKQEQVTQITNQLLKRLHPQGYFFIGTSESLDKEKCLVTYEAPSVYRHRQLEAPAAKEVAPAPSFAPSPVRASTAPAPLRVLCVDDSPTILALLKKILGADTGFKVVATASNGEEAAAALKQHKVDVMTLDLHMPVLGGLEYLKKYHKAGHPPVVIVSSVSRENRELAIESLECGARDYVEKPSMSDLKERGEEICNKLRVAVSDAQQKYSNPAALERSFQATNDLPPEKARNAQLIILGSSRLPPELEREVQELRRANVKVRIVDPATEALTDEILKPQNSAERRILYVSQELDDTASNLVSARSSQAMIILNDFQSAKESPAARQLRHAARFRFSHPSLAFHAIEYFRTAA